MLGFVKPKLQRWLAQYFQNGRKDRKHFLNPAAMMQIIEAEMGLSWAQIKDKVANATLAMNVEHVHQLLESLDIESSIGTQSLTFMQQQLKIYQHKTSQLLDLIENIAAHNYSAINNSLHEFDLSLDKYGYIVREDARRLIIPAIYNLRQLNKIMEESKSFSNYLVYHTPNAERKRQEFMRDYANAKLQMDNLYNNQIPGYIPLSERQIKHLEQQNLQQI